MTTERSELVAANRAQKVSETDSFTERRYQQMARHIGAASRVLDVGANTGRGGLVLRDHIQDADIVGVEMVPERAAKMKTDVYSAVHACALEDLPDLEPFDAIVMGELLEHIPYASLEGFLQAALRLLRADGKLILTTPNPHYFLLGRRSGGSVLGGAHVSVHCPVALAQHLRHLGLDIVCTRGTGRVSLKIGTRWPLFLYGSFLLVARRGAELERAQQDRSSALTRDHSAMS